MSKEYINELTFELTDYCPHRCHFCSSATTDNRVKATYLSIDLIRKTLQSNGPFNRLNLSGGEPLAHPRFYDILELCKLHTNDVVVYTNAINHIMFNVHVIDNVYVEANVTVTGDVDRVHILKRIEQGREKTRPEVHFSKNWECDCKHLCRHRVMRPTGRVTHAPCSKWKDPEYE